MSFGLSNSSIGVWMSVGKGTAAVVGPPNTFSRSARPASSALVAGSKILTQSPGPGFKLQNCFPADDFFTALLQIRFLEDHRTFFKHSDCRTLKWRHQQFAHLRGINCVADVDVASLLNLRQHRGRRRTTLHIAF